jgi:hypothetical protein
MFPPFKGVRMFPRSFFASAIAVALFAACTSDWSTPIDSNNRSSLVESGTQPDAPHIAANQGAGHAATVIKFRSTGAFGDLAFGEGLVGSEGGIVGILRVDRVEPKPGKDEPTTFLFYIILQCDEFGSCGQAPLEEGSGLIPNEDLVGNGRNKLVLDTDTSDNPNFFTSFSRGPIHVEWTSNDIIVTSERSQTSTQLRFEDFFLIRTNGSFTSASAFAEGNILGFEVTPVLGGTVGTSHDRFFEVIH